VPDDLRAEIILAGAPPRASAFAAQLDRKRHWQMRGVIYYYSGSGNTKLACSYIARYSETSFDLVDVVREREADLEPYDIVGFATFTDCWGPPQLFQSFIQGLPHQEGKLAFVFNSYGFVSGKTLYVLAGMVSAKGFDVISGHSLRMPESYPPMIARGMGAQEAPSQAQMSRFDAFISDLDLAIERASEGQMVERHKVRVGVLNSLLPVRPRTAARQDMGEILVDEMLCVECGTCERQCPYGAIRLDPKPVFDLSKCYGCWRCYNRCPEQAIYTAKLRGKAHYPKPSEGLVRKLSY
jgi:ferredoxin